MENHLTAKKPKMVAYAYGVTDDVFLPSHTLLFHFCLLFLLSEYTLPFDWIGLAF